MDTTPIIRARPWARFNFEEARSLMARGLDPRRLIDRYGRIPLPGIEGGAITVGPTDRLKTTLIPTLSVLNPLRLDLGTTYQAIRYRLTGSFTVATAVATILEDSPLGLIRNIDLLIGVGQPLRSMDARAMWRLNEINQGTQPRITAPAGAIGTSTFSAEFYTDLYQPDLVGKLPSAFWLDADFLSSILLNIQLGAEADVATPGAGTDTLSNVQLGIDLIEIIDQGGPLSRMQIIRQVVRSVLAVGTLDMDPFTGGGVNYRGFLIHATSGNADPNRATGDDTIIGDVSLLVPSRRVMDAVPWQRLVAETKRVYGLESSHPGWALVDFARMHHLGEVLDTTGEQNVTMRFTIAAAPANAIVQIYPIVFQRRLVQGRPDLLPLPVPKRRIAA